MQRWDMSGVGAQTVGRACRGKFREQADRFLPLKGGALYSSEINKSVMEHYQVTPHMRWNEVELYKLRLEGYGVGMPQSER